MQNELKYTVIITSVIYFNKRPLSYSPNRSIFSPEERLSQTLKTIKSINEHIPNAKIFFLEGGNRDIGDKIESLVHKYIYIGNIKLINLFIKSKFKGLGEVIMLLFLDKKIDKKNYIFKISGRYYLNDNFDINKWADNFTCKLYKNSISTRLYGIPPKGRKMWRFSLILSIPFLLIGKSLENLMFFFIKTKNMRAINTLGVSGAIAPDGKIINE